MLHDCGYPFRGDFFVFMLTTTQLVFQANTPAYSCKSVINNRISSKIVTSYTKKALQRDPISRFSCKAFLFLYVSLLDCNCPQNTVCLTAVYDLPQSRIRVVEAVEDKLIMSILLDS